MKDETKVVLKNQISVEEYMIDYLPDNNKKPFIAVTVDGVYSFFYKRQAQAFAMARNGFFDTEKNISRSYKAKKQIMGGEEKR